MQSGHLCPTPRRSSTTRSSQQGGVGRTLTIYQWRAALREGRLSDKGGEVVGFVPVEMPMAPSVAPNDDLPGTDNFAAVSTIEIGLPSGRSLKVPASLPSTELRRLLRTVEGA